MQALDAARSFLGGTDAARLAHGGRRLIDHLEGTCALLEAWQQPPAVCRAGLFHSIYGTSAYDAVAVPTERRSEVAAQIGGDAEALVYLFSVVDRDSLYAGSTVRDRAGHEVALSREARRALLHIAAANWLEQRAELSLELRRARCTDYFRISEELAPAARRAVRSAIDDTLREAARDSSLTALFAFDHSAAIDANCAALDVRYLTAISHQLNARLTDELAARLGELPDAEYLALVRAPETCFHIAADGTDLARYVASALDAAEWRAGTRDEVAQPAWSAMGDLYVPPGAHRGAPACEDHFDPDRVYRAPAVGGWVTVDLHGPAVSRPLAQIAYKKVPFGPAEPFTPAERAAVLDKLAGAFAGIERTNPLVIRFLRYALAVICPRKQTQPHLYPNSFKGSSTATAIHRTNIYNLQFENVDIARIAQSIIHESVHNHLYKREVFEPTLIDVEAGEALRVRSPWSGNTLDLYVFAHSSTVYYALHSFFAHPAARASLPADTVEYFRSRAITGFASRAWAEIVEAHAELFAPGMRRDLWAMRDRVAGAL